ncbi:unnamed protein product [Arctogadus glacialis]
MSQGKTQTHVRSPQATRLPRRRQAFIFLTLAYSRDTSEKCYLPGLTFSPPRSPGAGAMAACQGLQPARCVGADAQRYAPHAAQD